MKQNYKLFSIDYNSIAKNHKLFIFILLLFSFKSFGQTTNCNNNAGGEITVNTTCITIPWDSNNNTDYWDSATGCNADDRDDVWGWFVATNTTTTISYTPDTRDAILTLFDSACSTAMGSLACSDSGGAGATETIVYATTIGTTYRVRVQRSGSNNDMTGDICVYSPVASGYCSIATTSSSYWIDNVTTTGGFTNINNTTTYSAGGYGDYSATNIVSQAPASDIAFNITTSSGTHGINIWVDWNNDLDFSDAGEKVYASGDYVASASGLFTVPGATLAGNYRMRVVANWSATDPSECGSTTYTEAEDYTITVTAPPTCYSPENLTASASSTTSGNASWTAPTLGTTPVGYEYIISTSSTTPVVSGTVIAGTSTSFTGLTADTTYYVFVRASCGGSDYSLWAVSSFFTGFCSSTSTSTTYYIDDFSTTGGNTNITNNSSGLSASGYGNFTGQAVSQQIYGSVNFSTAISSGTHGFNIWVDWNDDLDFDDTGEKVYTSGAYIATATGSFAVPASTTVGDHRMRIRANYSSTNPSACGSITSGETEDYTFTVTASACSGIPTAVVVSNLTYTTGTVSWTASSPAPTNGYQYYVTTSAVAPTSGTTPTGSTAAGVTTVNLTGLTADTTYYVYIRNNCGSGDYSPWTVEEIFNTGYCDSTSTSTTYYIDDFSTTGGTINITNNNSGLSGGGYGNFTGQSVSQINYGTVTFTTNFYDGTYTYGFNIWIDWNNDFDFDDTDELVYASGAYVASATGNIVVPGTATLGDHRMRIRANYNSTNPSACGEITSGETEDYTFTVLPPLPCGENPENIAVTVDTQTSVTVNWTEPTPAPANGYDYYLSLSNATPSAATTPTGSTAAGVTTINLTGLTSGSTYYIWIRSVCGAPDGNGVGVGPESFYMPTCAIGPGTGTTDLGCPSVLSGGLGLSGADPAPLTCTSGSPCVDLEATYLDLGDTSDYTVESITYAPPYQFDCLRNPVSVNVDDVWSPQVDLPFDFCFYGNTYSSCTIGSNGILSFDLANAGTSSGYSFSNNLPSTTGSLYENSIYGVYHDIDPSEGGEVGWELITLNSGCRALVASWHDVPMFSDNTILYTGMMVLYENTNVIEVYIENKEIDGTWNDGNAIVGLQNDDATIAHTAPGRNGLDTDWTVTNEAWRFVPSGTSITTLTWYEGSGTSGTVLGTTDILNVCPTSTTTYTAEVTYTLCDGSTLIELDETTVTVTADKVWDGSTSTDWDTASNWTPAGVPTSVNCILIPNTINDPIISPTTDAEGYNLAIESNATLLQESGSSLTIVDGINISTNGYLNLEDSASLIQINNVNNSGISNIERDSQPIYRYDYTYWGSPMTTTSNFTLFNLSPGTLADKFYSWQPTLSGNAGDWLLLNPTSTNMETGLGYAIRAPQTFSTNPSSTAIFTGTFTGTPSNGDINIPISVGTDSNIGISIGGAIITADDDQWNLISNPYPSAIDIIDFLSEPTNIPLVDGTIYLWTHNSAPDAAYPDPFYNDFVMNYTSSDYASVNFLGSTVTAATGGQMPSQYIASGQAFFVLGLSNGNALFNNNMRVQHDNDIFFRNSVNNTTSTHTNFNDLEKHRIWLNLSNNNGGFSQILVGYVDGATLGWDRGLDGKSFSGNAVTFYSVTPDNNLTIQGRPLPFDNADVVPLGFKATSQNSYRIGIDHIDDLFNNQDIYLKDNYLNIDHNLKLSAYVFTSEEGEFNDRFELHYNNSLLSTTDNNLNETEIKVISNNELYIISEHDKIKEIIVYDILGRKLQTYNNVQAKAIPLEGVSKANRGLIIKITLKNNTILYKKAFF